jgi:hypothetical protein
MRGEAAPWPTPIGISLIDGKILVKAGFAAVFDRITVANSLFFQSTCPKFPKRANRELNRSNRELNRSNSELNPACREFN